jgi:hypothetical protein
MFIKIDLIKRITLAALALILVLAAFPIMGASAADLTSQINAQPYNTRLERVWAREQLIYKRAGNELANASNFIARVQSLIDKANGEGWDTASVQAAMYALNGVIPAVQAAHSPGAALIAGHAGFDANGKVTDRTTAIASAKSLAKVLKDTRTAMDGTGKALRQAIKDFREVQPRLITTPAF